MSEIKIEELYRNGFIHLDRVVDTSFGKALSETHTRIVLENPDESLIREVAIVHNVARGDAPGYGLYEIRLVPHREQDLRTIYNTLEQAGVNFKLGQPNGGGIYSETPADELDQDLQTCGYVLLYSKYTNDPSQLAPDSDPTQSQHLEALRRSRMLGGDEVSNAVLEAVHQGMRAAQNDLFNQEDPATQRRMMHAIGGSLHRIYDRIHNPGPKR